MIALTILDCRYSQAARSNERQSGQALRMHKVELARFF